VIKTFPNISQAPSRNRGFALRLARASILSAFACGGISAQSPSSQPPPKVSFRYEQILPATAFAPRGLIVHVELGEGWHINSDAPSDSFLVATTLEVKADGLKFGKPKFPEPVKQFSQAMGEDVLLFTGAFDVAVPTAHAATPGAKAPAMKDEIHPHTRVTLNYQACNNYMCYPPKSVTAEK
jgi:hypothetical protein